MASAAGHLEAVEALLESKADNAAVGDNGETALMLACAQVIFPRPPPPPPPPPPTSCFLARFRLCPTGLAA